MRFYRWLLRLLPARVRDEQGPDILEHAEQQWQDAAGRGLGARLRLAAGLGTDVLAQAVALRASAWHASLRQDTAYAIRQLRRAPGFAAVAIGTLALGIGANTVVFSFVNAFYLAPAEFPNAERLISISETSLTELCAGCAVGTSYPTYQDLRGRLTSFETLEAYDEDRATLSAPLVPRLVRVTRMTGGGFAALGVTPVLGRTLEPRDDQPGAPLAVLLGYSLWQQDLGGRPDVLGMSIRVNSRPAEIVGVMPNRFGFPQYADLWLPMTSAEPSTDRSDRRYGVIGRLRAGRTLEQARQEVALMMSGVASEHPREMAAWSPNVESIADERIGVEAQAFVVMLGAVSLVLAVACANLAALFLSRVAERRRELTVRAALGASRSRLVRQILTEQLVLGTCGGLAGWALAAWGVRRADLSAISEVPYHINIRLDWRVATFCALVSLLVSVLVGLLPAFLSSRPALIAGLREGAGTTHGLERGPARWRQVLIAAELALVLMLLAGAGLMGRTFLRFAEAPRGYSLEGLMLAELPLAGDRFADAGAARFALADLEARLEALPDLTVGLERTEFIAGFGAADRSIRVEGLADVPPTGSPRFAFAVSPRYFEALGLSVRVGRSFTKDDDGTAERVAIVNQQMAEALWPGRHPLGQRLQIDPGEPTAEWWTIVGVVSNLEGAPRPGRPASPQVYVPLDQRPGRPVRLLWRSTRTAADVLPHVRAALAAVDPDEPLADVRTAPEDAARGYWFVGYFAAFYGAFGAFALAIAVIGVYGVTAQTVGERMREFGIRVALGADRPALYRLVLGRSLFVATIGVVIGLSGALLVTRFIGFLLFGADPQDPAVFASVSVLLAASTLLASYWPARKAARLDPATVLRSE